MHLINKDSLLFGLTEADFKNAEGEFIIDIKVLEDHFGIAAVARTSYKFSKVIYGAKYETMYIENSDNTKKLLDLNRFSVIIKVPLNKKPDLKTG